MGSPTFGRVGFRPASFSDHARPKRGLKRDPAHLDTVGPGVGGYGYGCGCGCGYGCGCRDTGTGTGTGGGRGGGGARLDRASSQPPS